MKTLFKLFLFLCLLVVIALLAGYFVLTNPSFQKGLVEKQLPAGSSIEHVHVKLGSFELSGLKLQADDGTLVEISSASSEFSPLAAWRAQTIQLGELVVSGVKVDLPEPSASASPSGTARPSPASGGSDISGSTSTVDSTPAERQASTSTPDPQSPYDVIYQLGELDWLFDIQRILIDGELNDGQGGNYAFKLECSAIGPSLDSSLRVNLDSTFVEVQANGVKAFNGSLELSFTQKVTGGFERFQIQVDASAQDVRGANLLSLSQEAVLDINSNEQAAGVKLNFNANVPEPQRFIAELAQVGALTVDGKANAELLGESLTLSDTALSVTAGGQPIVTLDLTQVLTLGGTQNFEGELLDLSLINLPMAWLSPWMPEGLVVSAQPLSMNMTVSGESGGAMVVAFKEPIRLDQLSVSQAGQAMIDQVNVSVHPLLTVNSDQSLHYRLDEFRLDDRYGTFVSGNLSGSLPAELSADSNLPDGLRANVDLDIKLQPLMQQPALKGMTSIMNGSLRLDVDVDAAEAYPIQLQTSIQSLRARGMPGTSQNYRFAAQAKQPSADTWLFGANLMAGNDSRPSTDAQLSGSVSPERKPMAFDLDLKAERIRQADLELLAAAFSPSGRTATTSTITPSTPVVASNQASATQVSPQADQTAPSRQSTPPPWADLDGKVSVQLELIELNSRQTIEDLTAKLRVSEPLLDVSELSAVFGEGTFAGAARVDYTANSLEAYTLKADLNVKQLDPAISADPRSGAFPIRGRFDADVRVQGTGATLEAALDQSESALLVTGQEGVLTAFELDQRQWISSCPLGREGHWQNMLMR